jgi:hypothetical protein
MAVGSVDAHRNLDARNAGRKVSDRAPLELQQAMPHFGSQSVRVHLLTIQESMIVGTIGILS